VAGRAVRFDLHHVPDRAGADGGGVTTSVHRVHAAFLRRLAINDERTTAALFGSDGRGRDATQLDDRQCALLRLGALTALDAAPNSYQWAVAHALGAGATEPEIVAVLASTAPVIGPARLMRAAAAIGVALGYELGVTTA
jgi:alkylhydroperoxidase/carboxymuconolactone decarboxylase family protein YurZ